jgi:hypothetical protein
MGWLQHYVAIRCYVVNVLLYEALAKMLVIPECIYRDTVFAFKTPDSRLKHAGMTGFLTQKKHLFHMAIKMALIPHPHPDPPLEGEGANRPLSLRERARVRVG